MTRGFEAIKEFTDDQGNPTIKLPERNTKHSAGYDFYAKEDVEIPSHLYDFIKAAASLVMHNIRGENTVPSPVTPVMVKTGVKSYMQPDEYLALYNRSSNPKKLGLIISNSVGIVDSDYYNNPDNEGEIGFAFYNIFPFKVTIKKNEKLGQGIFSKFLIADDDNATASRSGGWGSTGK